MLRTVLTTFALVFLAELGDKTQLAIFVLSTRGRPWAVFIGAGGALLASTLLAVILGYTLPRFVPVSATRILHYIVGGLFVFVGAWTLWKA